MENLPVEMVEKIVQLLTPQDLARCSAVCHYWHEIFNQDWMWKPHCDPEVEEPLRTTPCVVTPAFVAPEKDNSTLSPICHWKLAYMRETHLWKNWRRKDIMSHKMERIIESRGVLGVNFLTETVVVAWCSNIIEIVDVSEIPATLVAKTDRTGSDYTDRYLGGWCVSETILLAVKEYSIEIFSVDIMDKSIKLENDIHLGCDSNCSVVKGNLYLYWNTERSKLITIDINTGKTVKEEPCPVVVNEKVKCGRIASSATCDFLVFIFQVGIKVRNCCLKYYIYSLEKLTFLPGPVADQTSGSHCYDISLHGTWLALMDYETLTVYNLHNREVILSYDIDVHYFDAYECFNGFVLWGSEMNESWVKYYCPLDRSLTTLYEGSGQRFHLIDDKFIAIYHKKSMVSEGVLKLSGHSIEKCDISIEQHCRPKINRSCTKVLIEKLEDLDHVWYIRRLW